MARSKISWAIRSLLAAALVLLLVLAAVSRAPTPKFLTAAEVEPSQLLGPPPAEGSPVAKAELAELHAIAAASTPAQHDHARLDGKTKNASIFAAAMGPGFDLKALPATAKLMKDVRRDQKVAATLAKDHFRRARPWIVDGSLKSCGRFDLPHSSYPSSHTALAYSMATVLADLAPDRRTALMARAQDYGHSRLVCGMHFPSDVAAGAKLGEEVGAALLRNAAFQADRDAAAVELKAARVIR